MKKLIVLLICLLCLTGCMREAETANYNLRKDADYFNVYRKVTAINTWTDTVLFSVEGYCSVDTDSDGDLNVTIKTGDSEYKLFYAHLSSNVTYTCEQMDASNVSGYAYEMVWFPDIEQIRHGLIDIVDRDGESVEDKIEEVFN